MKSKIIFSVLIIILPLYALPLSERCIQATIGLVEDVRRSPLAYTGWIGTAMATYNYWDNPLALAAIGASFCAYHASVAKSWWRLRNELSSYPDESTDSNILKRTDWSNASEDKLDIGSAINRYFNNLQNDGLKKRFQDDLKLKAGGQQKNLDQTKVLLDRALNELKQRIEQYSTYSNLYYSLERAIGRDPLATDYLFEENIHNPDGTLAVLLEQHTSGSWIAHSFTIRWGYLPSLGIAVPWWYTWSYRTASKCIVKALQQYGRLKAIKRILERQIPSTGNTTYDVNLRLRRDDQGVRQAQEQGNQEQGNMEIQEVD